MSARAMREPSTQRQGSHTQLG